MNRKAQLDKQRGVSCTANRAAQTDSTYRSVLRQRITLLIIILLIAPSAYAQLRGFSDPLRTRGRIAPVDSGAAPQAPITYDAASSVIKIPPGFNIRALNGKPKNSRPLDQSDEDRAALPHWTGKFSYEGVEYKYTMVGTDPAHGSATTVIPTEIICLRLVFSNGIVLDPTTDVYGDVTILQSVINSPIFRAANFSAGSTNLGYTQFGDAFQRANFWNLVSRRAPDYHVLLGQPQVFIQTIIVPEDKGFAGQPFGLNGIIGFVAGDWLDQQIQQLITTLGIDPQTLPILLTHNAVGFGLGYHNVIVPSGQDNRQRGVQTYLQAADFDHDIFAGTTNNTSDVDVLSHEVSEWLDDPFINNLVPPFVEPEAFFGCSGFHQEPDGPLVGLLEVGDPIQTPTFPEIPVTLNGMTYHLQDEVFLSWFTRSSPSTAVNGYYSFANALKTFAQLCPNFTDYTFTPVDEPDGFETHLLGINNNGQVVGYYYDFEFGAPHGFLLNNGSYTNIDFPGVGFTSPLKINDAGNIAGYYFDAANHLHGFLFSHGSFRTIDAPGATATFALGINNRQEIVGGYVGPNGVVHGFIQQDGQFRTVDLSFAFEDELEAINDSGEMVGDYDTGNVSDNFGFIGRPNHFEPLMFPGSFLSSPHSINREREVVGWYYYPTYSNFFDPLPSGFIKNGQNNTRIRVFSNGSECPTTLDGNNDAGQAVGSFFDPSIGVTRGVIVTPKKPRDDAGDDR